MGKTAVRQFKCRHQVNNLRFVQGDLVECPKCKAVFDSSIMKRDDDPESLFEQLKVLTEISPIYLSTLPRRDLFNLYNSELEKLEHRPKKKTKKKKKGK